MPVLSPMFRTALILGLLAAVEAFAIDMYLPAMPEITRALGTDIATMQTTLTLYFVAFGLAQLIWGPLADQYGRKPPLYAGMGLFVLASVGCALAPTVGWLTGFRILQGLGAAAAMVVPRAVIRDMYTGAQATRIMAMVMLVISVSPMLAPLAGSAILAVAGWRDIFWALVVAGGVGIYLLARHQPETLPPARRVRVDVASLLRGSRILLRDPVFMGLTFVGGFGFASFFVFIASATYVYTDQYGLTPTGFSVAFAINAIGFFAASQLAGPLSERYGITRIVRLAVVGFAACCLILLAVVIAGGGSLAVVVAGLFAGNAFLGLVIPTTMVMALDPHGEIAGLASSLGGALQMTVAGLMVTLAGPFFDGTALPMVATIAVCAVLTLAVALWVLPRVVVEPEIAAAL